MEETAPSPVPAGGPGAGADVFPCSPPRTSQQPGVRQAVAAAAPPPPQPVRIFGRNVNGTVVQTSMPQNEAELQLYRVMQRASLLSYYDTLLEMGGDDVQQLCDAGEEEFLEIMALVGMASKPLHVRRLQKALQEWLTNPAVFQTPVLVPTAASGGGGGIPSNKAATPVVFPGVGSYSPNARQQVQSSASSAVSQAAPAGSLSAQTAPAAKLHAAAATALPRSCLPGSATPPGLVVCHGGVSPLGQPGTAAAVQLLGQFPSSGSGCCPVQRRKSLSPPASSASFAAGASSSASEAGLGAGPSVGSTGASSMLAASLPLSHSPGVMQTGNYESSSCGSQGTTPSPGSNSAMAMAPQSPTLCLQTTPILLESQVQRLAEAAERLAATLRPLNPKPQSGIKKKMCKNLEMVMAMPDGDPRRMEEIRKYAAIYGRFDCKRKPEKPLTLHEVSVNEAAAQICRYVPALLTRRDELFPLARRVVRDSGHYYTKSLLHSADCYRSVTPPRTTSSRENGDGDLSGGDEPSALTGSGRVGGGGTVDPAKRRKLDLRCEEDSAVGAGKDDNSADPTQQQEEALRLRCINFSRNTIAIDSDSNSMQLQQIRHRKRQRRRRSSKSTKSMPSPVWQSCNENSNMVIDGVVEGLDDSDGCYSSFDDDWNDCNEDECDENFDADTDGGVTENEETVNTTSVLHGAHVRHVKETDNTSCLLDKENDFNLKVIASCGDNIIAVANPALMNRNQSTTITKEQPIKEEITLRDRRD